MLVSEQKNKNITGIIIFISSLLLLLQSCSTVKVISDESFDKIANYQYGQDRSNLMEFSQIVQSLSKSPENRLLTEENILDFLKSDATFAGKQSVCRELRKIATEKSIDVLTDMLLNEKTVSIAKYALQNIPGNAVDEELISILNNAPNKSKMAIINILGARKSKIAVNQLGNLLLNKNKDISLAAVSALGKIGTTDCLNFLDPFIIKNNHYLKNAGLDSYLLVADNLVKENNRNDANKIYTKIYNLNVPVNIKQAALVGIINTSNNKAEKIAQIIKSEPNELKFIPISKIRELPENINLIEFAKLLSSLDPGNQIQLLSVFEDKKDKGVKPYVLKLLESNIKDVRIAAVKTLTNIGDKTDVLRFAQIAANTKGNESKYASLALELLQGEDIDKTILSNIAKANNNIRPELIKAIGSRLIKSAFNILIEYSNSPDKKTRAETFKALAEISTNKNLPKLVDVLVAQNDNLNRKKIERTISKVIVNYPDIKNADILIETYNSSTDDNLKISILRLLGFTNNPGAFEFLRNEINNDKEAIKIAALNGLSNWSTAKPLLDLEKILTSSQNDRVIRTALKGYTKFIGIDNTLSNKQKLGKYRKALQYAKTGNEKNLILDGVGHIDSFESLDILKSYINQPELKRTVNDGINRVSWHTFSKDPEKIKTFIIDLKRQINDKRFHSKSTELIDAIDKYIRKSGKK